jgi:hypothetical protein
VTGGLIALSGQMHRLYDTDFQWTIQRTFVGFEPEADKRFLDPFGQPPIAAYLFAPFATIPYLMGAAVWTAFAILCFIVSFRTLWPILPNLHQYTFARVCLLLLSTYPVMQHLWLGQDTVIGLLLLAGGLRLLLAKRDAAAGAVLAMGVYKPQLFLFVPILLLLQRRWRAFGSWTAVAAALTVFSVIVVGEQGVHDFLTILRWNANNDQSAVLWNTPSLLGLISLIRVQLSPRELSTAQAEIPGWQEALPASGIGALLVGLVGLGIALALVLIWLRSSQRVARSDQEFSLMYATMIILSALLNPHFHYYDGLVVLLAALLLFEYAPGNRRLRQLALGAYVLSWTYIIFPTEWLEQAPPYLALFGAPWVVVPVTGLFLFGMQLLDAQRVGERADRPSMFSRLTGLGPNWWKVRSG